MVADTQNGAISTPETACCRFLYIEPSFLALTHEQIPTPRRAPHSQTQTIRFMGVLIDPAVDYLNWVIACLVE